MHLILTGSLVFPVKLGPPICPEKLGFPIYPVMPESLICLEMAVAVLMLMAVECLEHLIQIFGYPAIVRSKAVVLYHISVI